MKTVFQTLDGTAIDRFGAELLRLIQVVLMLPPYENLFEMSLSDHQLLHALLQTLRRQLEHGEELAQLIMGLAPIGGGGGHGLGVQSHQMGVLAAEPVQQLRTLENLVLSRAFSLLLKKSDRIPNLRFLQKGCGLFLWRKRSQ